MRLPALLFFIACSSTSDPKTGFGFTGQGLCDLVTPADISAAVGVTVGAGVPSGVNAPSCTWQSANSQVAATIAASDPSTVGQIPFGLMGKPGAHVTAVANLGDAAYFAAGMVAPLSELDIKKNGRAIAVTAGNSQDPNYNLMQQQAAELAIGTAAAKNM